METIRVNMTPCEDIKTIHASQNDNEAREWGFELHNNGEKIDSSSISDQLVFKAYEGGTEQILPENGSTPTTSPFKGDIKYPQGLLSDQEFLYRESPTEEDGLAKITDIKGNTLNWNQLVQNGNFADGTNHWSGSMGTSVANNICTLTANSTSVSLNFNQTLSLKSNHKYLIKFDIMPSLNTSIMYNLYDGTDFNITKEFNATANTWYNYAEIVQPTNDIIQFYIRPNRTGTQGSTYKLKNVNIIDLTQMGLDITASDFTSLFSLPYYAYNQGSLLSFMGNGIKTVGKNLFDGNWESGSIGSGGSNIANDSSIRTYSGISAFHFEEGKTYTFSCEGTRSEIWVNYYFKDNSFQRVQMGSNITSGTFTVPSGVAFIRFRMTKTENDLNPKAQVEIGTSASSYEAYQEDTLSLPISTYFPNGMKSAGNVYDELTETKAITRIGTIDLGSLEWITSGGNRFKAIMPSDAFINSDYQSQRNAICGGGYQWYSGDYLYNNDVKGFSYYFESGENRLFMKNTTYTSVSDFKASLNNVYLYYELATPTETSFTTASLVTENAEIPLSNEDGTLIGKCTEELSAEPGFHDAKIKLADDDGECYSNKIQLHVERKPS